MKISAEDRDYIIEKVLEAEAPLNNQDVRGVLDAIDIWYLNNGFEPPDYEDYNAEGRKMQKVRDRIYEDNVLK